MKHLKVILSNTNAKLFQNNFVPVWNDTLKDLLRWDRLQLTLLGSISVIKMNVLPKTLFLFQTIPILITDTPFKQDGDGYFSIYRARGEKQELDINDCKMLKREELWVYQIWICTLMLAVSSG